MKKTLLTCIFAILLTACQFHNNSSTTGKVFNGIYTGQFLNKIAFPMGGIGAGMICLEGTGCISHVSVRNQPDIYNEPYMLATLSIKGSANKAKVIEGPVPDYKIFGQPLSGNGAGNYDYGFPRFEKATFLARFPFATVSLTDEEIPLQTEVTGWSPFTPCDEDNSSLPVAGLEYTFKNTSGNPVEAIFAYHSQNFMRIPTQVLFGGGYVEKGDSIKKIKNGFILSQSVVDNKPENKGDFAIYTLEDAVVDYCWFRGGWFDGQTQMWKDVTNMSLPNDTNTSGSKAASLYIPLHLKPGETTTVHLLLSWYVPNTNQKYGGIPSDLKTATCTPGSGCCSSPVSQYYEPWYSGRYKDIYDISRYWTLNYNELKSKSEKFSQTFFASDLPAEVLEAVSANFSILKSPTLLRQKDGRLWGWEGCFDASQGCCEGSCTHVWNYAQAISHLFPGLERTLRETEFKISQDEKGHQNFRSALPIRKTDHGWHAAADGQLGGIMKVYRDWRISGNTEWLKSLWPNIRQSFEYCSKLWDPKGKGIIEEPHHNTYDIEFWGPEGMCTSIYLGATQAMIQMARALGDSTLFYQNLYDHGKKFLENDLYNGEYFYQKTTWQGLETPNPLEKSVSSWNVNYSPEAIELLKKEGPKYQYGTGCLSDGIIGCWIGAVCGLPEFIDPAKVKSHLNAVYKYNFKTDLFDHENPQRPGYACGHEGGLLLCSWPKGNQPSLPFVYSNEVWTGIEYQVAAHLIMNGELEKGLNIVREVRKRYDGRIRNPFDEYECGHWYARAMASYSLLQGLTGITYDAIDKSLSIDSKIGNTFKSFLCTETGYGFAGLKNGNPFIDVVYGTIDVKKFINKTPKS